MDIATVAAIAVVVVLVLLLLVLVVQRRRRRGGLKVTRSGRSPDAGGDGGGTR